MSIAGYQSDEPMETATHSHPIPNCKATMYKPEYYSPNREKLPLHNITHQLAKLAHGEHVLLEMVRH
jgi:hypothetical protein